MFPSNRRRDGQCRHRKTRASPASSQTLACAEAFRLGTGRSPLLSPPVVAGTASGRPEAVADDEREGEVGSARSSREASEQSGLGCGGAFDHFEGRSWQGLHRHSLMTMIAYAFLQYCRLKTVRREKKNQRATASTDIAGRTPSHRRTHRSATTATMPTLQKMDLQQAAA